ncbi:DNA ligase (ATP) [Orbilia ellipsospora]|uniref:DNA ligase n=1 Tax=Orbilia ellipsospora TaxID=2528407 RepID=A0AAV9X3H9_9PEZI
MPRSRDMQVDDDDDDFTDTRRVTQEKEDEDAKYPNRPRNTKPSLLFSALYKELFNPLLANLKKPTGPKAKIYNQQKKPQEKRREIINRFISKWRKEVGNDIWPAFRLIMPDKDRERSVYGLKEKALGNILIKVLRISKDSDDAYNLMNWKQPRIAGDNKAAGAGDFAARCHDAISKRALRSEPGDMNIDEVNELLDQLAEDSKNQFKVIQEFYNRMNAEELQWLIKIVLKQMKVGATEKTFFDCWHQDADGLFNVASSLKMVCWDLWDPEFRLNPTEKGVKLMFTFQPQLAQFQLRSFEDVVKKMQTTEDDKTFWIEEKLDGERMQLHMDDEGNFKFWSRKAKDYTDHYGSAVDDRNGSLTRYLGNVFKPGVRNIILDGEMVTWDPIEDAMVAFGTLKSAVIAQRTDDPTAHRPFFRVFDILYLNDTSLVNYTLRDRRNALNSAVNPVSRRLEVHTYTEGSTVEDIKSKLRDVVAEASEGLVIKNPRSMYSLGDRNDDWLKVKPDYMKELGENFDLIIIGGYYGGGSRGGRLSSYMCGLQAQDGKYYSFCKVGGGFAAQDYNWIRHKTEGKWNTWNARRPPTEYIELASGQAEKPDEWIKPEDSVVISVKGAQLAPSDQFKVGVTLRFPRFMKIREDRSWDSALNLMEFFRMKREMEELKHEHDMQIERRRATKRVRKELKIAGADEIVEPIEVRNENLFDDMNFWIMTESSKPRKSKAEIEGMVKASGGNIFQSDGGAADVKCIADKSVVKVLTLKKKGVKIIRPQWIFDCQELGFKLPLEADRHMLYVPPGEEDSFEETVDRYGDSYYRDITVDDLGKILRDTVKLEDEEYISNEAISRLKDELSQLDPPIGWMFQHVVAYLDTPENAEKNHIRASADDIRKSFSQSRPQLDGSGLTLMMCRNILKFGNARITDDFEDEEITHIIVDYEDLSRIRAIRRLLSARDTIPRVTLSDWVEESWRDETLLGAENFPVEL